MTSQTTRGPIPRPVREDPILSSPSPMPANHPMPIAEMRWFASEAEAQEMASQFHGKPKARVDTDGDQWVVAFPNKPGLTTRYLRVDGSVR